MSGEFLLEVRAEEIPARMLAGAVKELATRVFEELMARRLGPAEVETGFTPRRLVLALQGLPSSEPDREEDVLGPPLQAAWRDGAWTAAAAGFARRCGRAVEELVWAEGQGGRAGQILGGAADGIPARAQGVYLADRRKVEGRPTPEVLAELVPRVLAAIPWAKTMRWGHAEGPWVRPIHGIICLFDGALVPLRLFGVEAGRETIGHPVLSPAPFSVDDLASYRQELAARGLEPRFEERRRRLWEGIERAAASRGGRAVTDPELLDKLTSICEIPGVVAGDLPAAALELPREVLQTSLRDHQSAFTAVDAQESLLPAFFTVMDRADDPRGRVRAGNEWVVAARLADARFFFEEDRKIPLGERAERLASLAFHEKLGSYADKAQRVQALTARICDRLGWQLEKEESSEAARLLKADLTTEMVKEFTSLQGVMGGIYAREEGYPEPVWQAIYDQYRPAGTSDPLPRGRVGEVVAVADRIDTLVGLFSLGLIPSGSKDPFALRRAAQGVARILIERAWRCDVAALVAEARALYAGSLAPAAQLMTQLHAFFADRLRYLLSLEGFAHDEIEAGLVERGGGGMDFAALRARVAALRAARDEPNFRSVVLAAKRIENILQGTPTVPLDPQLLREPAERALHAAYTELRRGIEDAVEARDYRQVLARVEELAPVLDRFFTEILVMDPDPELRSNRLALLGALRNALAHGGKLHEMAVERPEARSPADGRRG